ncbi:MAG: hypothetical protein IJ439_06765 [Tyzzerella sp.]|nr:hypothetical protein [Tyzzerella sp.]
MAYPEVQTLEEALVIIEVKRLRLLNPNNHNFLCINIHFEREINSQDIIANTNKAAEALNEYFLNDLHIISLVYRDYFGKIHSLLIVRDIEKSMDVSFTYYLEPRLIQEIFVNALPHFYISVVTNLALFSFNGDNCELPYDGVFHVECSAFVNTAQ